LHQKRIKFRVKVIMKKSHSLLSLLLLPGLAGTPLVFAQDTTPARATDYQPSSDEPRVVIRPGENATYYEYRVKGELVEIRVEPSVGPVYYLVPAEGGGYLRQDGSQLAVPSWVLFEW
jgi:hypothetical protein